MKSIIKSLLPAAAIKHIKNIKSSLDKNLLSLAQRNSVLSNLYCLVSGGFTREHHAVLKGRNAYYKSLNDIGESCALLRRNTHRLEKGLIMRPRRKVFAEGFITETVNCYCDAIVSQKLANAEKKWATDVLDEYFSIIGYSLTIEKAQKNYELARHNYIEDAISTIFPSESGHYKPYQKKQLPALATSYDELKKLFIRRRSVRWYEEKSVPENLIQKAANIASFAPSACNRQPYRFLFSNEKDKAVAIAKCAGGTTGFAENLPSIIAIIGDLSAYPFDRDRHLIYIDGSLAAMQLMLAMETLGLSTCPINWPEVESSERKIRELIALEDYERVIMLLAVGYADTTGGIPYSQKKENSLILEKIS